MLSSISRFAAAALGLLLTLSALAPAVNAQSYGPPPIMSAPGWSTVENAGQTWDGTWTFTDQDHRTMAATWTNRQTGERVDARRMSVRQSGNRIIVERPGVGTYVGVLSDDGRTLRGTMSWIQGTFTARASDNVGRRGDGDDRRDVAYAPPMMRAPGWVTVENAGQTWDGTWTFTDADHHTMSARWVNRQTGERVYAPRMSVRQDGRQITIRRPGVGEYVGTLSDDGRSLRGTMSWLSGSFTARM